MNYRYVVNQLFALLMVLGGTMTLVEALFFAAQSFGERDADADSRMAIALTGLGCVLIGAAVWWLTRQKAPLFRRREAMLLVALSWLAGGVVGALPYFLWAHLSEFAQPDHPFRSFVNCYFESVSGFTTAGSSILTDIEGLPRSLLLWRSVTQWIGGIGIVVMFVAVLPMVGAGAKRMFFSEVSGPIDQGVTPDIKSTARVLLSVYVMLTLAQVFALIVCGMGAFDAVCHSFTTLATGGFSPKNASVGAYDSTAIDIVVSLFMILGGVNFAVYIMLVRGRVRTVLRNKELRLYLILFFGGTALVTWLIAGTPITTTAGATAPGDVLNAVRYALFNVASVQTTTGFATANYDLWPILAKATMFALIFIGGSAGSTAGGVKVIRIIILFKVMLRLLEQSFRPHVVRPIKVEDTSISEAVQMEVLGFTLATIVVLALASLLLMVAEPLGEIDITTAVSANLACYCTTGPGFSKVGPMANFGWMTDFSKMVLILVMVLGRLELVALLALLTPHFWREG